MESILNNISTIRKQKGIRREDMADRLGIKLSSYGKMERGEVSLSVDRLYAIGEIFEMSASEILEYNKPVFGNVTYVPIKAQAGVLSDLFDNINKNECFTINLPFFRDTNLYMVDVDGNSMNPTVSNGDYAVIKQETDSRKLKYGMPYMIDSTEGRVIKRIEQHQDDDLLLLKSDNDTYKPYAIDKNSILSIWEVKGFVSKDLSPRNIYQKRLQQLEEHISELSQFVRKV